MSKAHSNGMERILAAAHPVLPVLTITRRADAIPLAEALHSAGITVLEITLRSDCAIDAIGDIARALPTLSIGAGSVYRLEQVQQAVDCGAAFLVSPGFDDMLAEHLRARHIPWLPGVMTPGEMMRASRLGYDLLKLFPATSAGGMALLRAVHGPLAHLRFCPTGGITATNFRDYLTLPNVACVGGSWLAPEALLAARDWSAIGALATACRT